MPKPLPLAGKGLGWGVGSLQCLADEVHHTLNIAQHLVIPKAQHVETLKIQMGISRSVRAQSLICIVLAAIDFNDKPRGITGKIDYQMINRDLSAKVKSFGLQRAQLLPKPPFGKGLIFPQLAGNLVCHLADRVCGFTPPRRPAAADPPRQGEGFMPPCGSPKTRPCDRAPAKCFRSSWRTTRADSPRPKRRSRGRRSAPRRIRQAARWPAVLISSRCA